MSNCVSVPGHLQGVWECFFCTERSSRVGNKVRKPILFTSKAAFVSHFNRTCHICDIEFTSQTTAHIHRRIHKSPVAKHVCNLCEKNFKDKESFASHTKDHKPYKCTGCYSDFRGFNALVTHAKSHNKCGLRQRLRGFRRDGVAPTQNVCFGCKKQCENLRSLIRHFGDCRHAIQSDVGHTKLEKGAIRANLRATLEASAALEDAPDGTSVFHLVDDKQSPQKRGNVVAEEIDLTTESGPVHKKQRTQKVLVRSRANRIQAVQASGQVSFTLVKNSGPIAVASPQKKEKARPATPVPKVIEFSEAEKLWNRASNWILTEESRAGLPKVFGKQFMDMLRELIIYVFKDPALSVTDVSRRLPKTFQLSDVSIHLPLVVFVKGKDSLVMTREANVQNKLEEGIYFTYKHQGVVLRKEKGFNSVHADVAVANTTQARHFNVTEAGLPYMSEQCKFRSFVDKMSLYECSLCSIVFVSKEDCHRHLSLCCHDCLAEFSSPQELFTHILDRHEGTKDTFECPYCQKRCCHLLSLCRHVKHFHPGTIGAEIDDIEVDCLPAIQCPNECRALFKGIAALRMHREAGPCSSSSSLETPRTINQWIGTREPLLATFSKTIYSCFLCNNFQRFPSSTIYQEHLKVKHGASFAKDSNCLTEFNVPFRRVSGGATDAEEDYDNITPKARNDQDPAHPSRNLTEVTEIIMHGIRKSRSAVYGVEVSLSYSTCSDTDNLFIPVKVLFNAETKKLQCSLCDTVVNDVAHLELEMTDTGIEYECVKVIELRALEEEKRQEEEDRRMEEEKQRQEEELRKKKIEEDKERQLGVLRLIEQANQEEKERKIALAKKKELEAKRKEEEEAARKLHEEENRLKRIRLEDEARLRLELSRKKALEMEREMERRSRPGPKSSKLADIKSGSFTSPSSTEYASPRNIKKEPRMDEAFTMVIPKKRERSISDLFKVRRPERKLLNTDSDFLNSFLTKPCLVHLSRLRDVDSYQLVQVTRVSLKRNAHLLYDEELPILPEGIRPMDLTTDDVKMMDPVIMPPEINLSTLSDPIYESGPFLFGTHSSGWVENNTEEENTAAGDNPRTAPTIEWNNDDDDDMWKVNSAMNCDGAMEEPTDDELDNDNNDTVNKPGGSSAVEPEKEKPGTSGTAVECNPPRQAQDESDWGRRGLLREKAFYDISNNKAAEACPVCLEWFTTYEQMIAHQVFNHLRHFCQHCGQIFLTGQEKSVHLVIAHDRHPCPSSSRTCNAVLSTHHELVQHSMEVHGILYCPFCAYPFTKDNMELHLRHNHFIRGIHGGNNQSLFEAFSDRGFQIVSDQRRKTVQCTLCPMKKPFPRDKVYNHLRFRHHLLLEKTMHLLEKCNFTTNQGVCDNINDAEVEAVTNAAHKQQILSLVKERVFVMEGSGGPDAPYNCPECDGGPIFGDSGLHLIFVHQYRFCQHCSIFFSSPEDLRRHSTAGLKDHPSYDCTKCYKGCEDPLDLMRHRARKHNMFTCYLCPMTVYQDWDRLKVHFKRDHKINHPTLVGEKVDSMRTLLTLTLLRYISVESCIECRMCVDDPTGSPRHFGRDQGLLMLKHLRSVHMIKDPKQALSMLDGRRMTALNMGFLVEDCMLCGGAFRTAIELKKHLMVKHPMLQPKVAMIKMDAEDLQQIRMRTPPPVDSIPANTVTVVDQAFFEDVDEATQEYFTNPGRMDPDEDEDRKIITVNYPMEHNIKKEPAPITLDSDEEEEEDEDDEEEEEEEEELGLQMSMEEVRQRGVKVEPEADMTESDFAGPYGAKEIEGKLGKSPVFVECKLCSKVLPSIANFQAHMKSVHPDSFEEKNRPFPCELCSKSFHFASNLNAHRSKRHRKTEPGGEEYKCVLCPSVCRSKTTMRRHLLVSHKNEYTGEEFRYACKFCRQLFWSVQERTEHISQEHEGETEAKMAQCGICGQWSAHAAALRRHKQRMHRDAVLTEEQNGAEAETSGSAADKQMMRCQLCGHWSANKHSLRQHFQRLHVNQPLTPDLCWHCPICPPISQDGVGGVFFQNKSALDRHARESHSENVNFGSHVCRVCGKGFTRPSYLEHHLKINHGSFKCETCGKEFSTNKACNAHSKAAHDRVKRNAFGPSTSHSTKSPSKRGSNLTERGHSCRLCERKFPTKEERQIHYKIDHPGEQPFVCEFCQRGFSTRSAKSTHVKFQHANELYGPGGDASNMVKCDTCGKTLRKDSYREHLLIHSGARYKCTHCPKEFVQKSNLRRHIRIHLGIKPYKCDVCSKTFTDCGACNAHKATHDLNRRVECKYCGQVFSRGQKLRYHLRLHTGEGLLQCDFCEKVFTNPYSYKCHIKAVHGAKVQMERCTQCDWDAAGTATSVETKLVEHLKAKHPDMGTTCNDCGMMVRSTLELNRHVNNHHRGGGEGGSDMFTMLYHCLHCNKGFNSQTDVKLHLAQDHNITNEPSLHFTDGNREFNNIDPAQVAKHMTDELLRCWHCETGYLNGESLRKHLAKDTKLKRVCPVCFTKLSTVVKCNAHIIEEHPEVNVESAMNVLLEHETAYQTQKKSSSGSFDDASEGDFEPDDLDDDEDLEEEYEEDDDDEMMDPLGGGGGGFEGEVDDEQMSPFTAEEAEGEEYMVVEPDMTAMAAAQQKTAAE